MAETPKAVKNYQTKVKNVFITNFDKLNSILKKCMEEFSKKAYAAKLTYQPVTENENFDNIFDQFKSALEWKTSVEDIKEHYQKFIDILEELGGPAEDAAKDLADQLSAVEYPATGT